MEQAKERLRDGRQSMAALSLQVTAKDFRGPHSVTVIPLREEMAGKTRTAVIVTALLYGFRPDYIATVAAVSLILVGGSNTRMFRSGAPRLSRRSDNYPAAGIRGNGCSAMA